MVTKVGEWGASFDGGRMALLMDIVAVVVSDYAADAIDAGSIGMEWGWWKGRGRGGGPKVLVVMVLLLLG
jgi:hypothetical protein